MAAKWDTTVHPSERRLHAQVAMSPPAQSSLVFEPHQVLNTKGSCFLGSTTGKVQTCIECMGSNPLSLGMNAFPSLTAISHQPTSSYEGWERSNCILGDIKPKDIYLSTSFPSKRNQAKYLGSTLVHYPFFSTVEHVLEKLLPVLPAGPKFRG